MQRRHISLALLSALALGLTACSKQDTSTAAPPVAVAPGQAYSTVAAQAKGFAVGSLMSANAVYVLFDPQCPHCGHLWNAALPLHGKVKFVWVPVAIISAQSAPQGAALLQASNPIDSMTAHEQSILAGQGGMSASSSVPPEIEAAIKGNTQLLNGLGAESVPFIVAKHARTGEVLTRAGSLETQPLADFLGVTQP